MTRETQEGAPPSKHYLKDYCSPDYTITQTLLDVNIGGEKTVVSADMQIEALYDSDAETRPLILDGEELKLISIEIDEDPLSPDAYTLDEKSLTIHKPPRLFNLRITNEISPTTNRSCQGFYASGDVLCTQNEPEGFRHITYYLDRPDVMSIFKTRIEADKKSYAHLLANGNKVESGDLDDERHYVIWNDPFPKPSYLFAMVAGNFSVTRDSYTTLSGRDIALEIFVDKGDEDKVAHSMQALKSSMLWDEETFGLEYDLDIYMIVAVGAFNMGAMENKGLNIFNSARALANPKTATDLDFQSVEIVIAHEYFHNWTGNRITCRDWFQLTLKEGLTVFRDREYGEDKLYGTTARIKSTKALREAQFPSDSGPNAHPIQPDSYIQPNNLYSATVYQKGSEVIRMVATLLGWPTFRKGMDYYVENFDGQAATTDDFIASMEAVSAMDLSQFKATWYKQKGTPRIKISTSYDASAQSYTIDVEQDLSGVENGRGAKAFHLPIELALLNSRGEEMPLTIDGCAEAKSYLNLTQMQQRFVLSGVKEKPTPSFLRGFSAPVYLDYDYSSADLEFLMKHDSDYFNRYEAFQVVAKRELNALIAAKQTGQELSVSDEFIRAARIILESDSSDDDFKSETLQLPSLSQLIEGMECCDYSAAFAAREQLSRELASTLEQQLHSIYNERAAGHESYSVDQASIGRRALKNLALHYLLKLGKPEYIALALNQVETATNMTDEFAGLEVLSHLNVPERDTALQLFFERWKHDALVMDKWFSVQAHSHAVDTLSRVIELEKNEAFDRENPNKIKNLYGAFGANYINFHAACGEGYRYLADKVLEVDSYNPSIASRLIDLFSRYTKLDAQRRELMKFELERIIATPKLSSGVYEFCSQILNQPTN